MSFPVLYESNETDFTHLGLGLLVDCQMVHVTEERNGKFEIEIKYPMDGLLFNEIQLDRLVKTDASPTLKDQRFKLVKITKPLNGFITAIGEHVSYLTQDLPLKPKVGYLGNAQMALNTWKQAIVDENEFSVYSDILTTGSGEWAIDKVENARRALGGVRGSILDTYGGEYRFDNYRIQLFAERGTDNGVLIAYGKNLTDFEQEEQIENVYTSIYPYVILEEEDSEGEKLLTLPEYFIDSDHVNKYARRKILAVDFSEDKITTHASLRTRVARYIKENNVGVPRVSMKVKFLDLAKTLDYKQLKLVEHVNLCDIVTVYFEKINLYEKAKVIKITWDVLLDSYHEIEIGEARASLSTAIDATIDNRTEAITERLNIIQTAANGKNKIFRDVIEPERGMKENDLWYKPVGEGETELYRYTGEMWKLEKVSAGLLAGTLDVESGDVDLINVNAQNIVGQNADLIRASFNAIGRNTQIEAGMINLLGSGGWRRNILTGTGIVCYNGDGAYLKAGVVGYFKGKIEQASELEDVMENFYGRHSVGIGVEPTHDIALGVNRGTTGTKTFTPSLKIRGENGNIEINSTIHPMDSSKGLTITDAVVQGETGLMLSFGEGGIFMSTGGGTWIRRKLADGGWKKFA